MSVIVARANTAAEKRMLYRENAQTATPGIAQGTNSIALGEAANTDLNANNSLAVGYQSNARLPYSVAISSGNFSTPGDAQSHIVLIRTVTTDDTPTELFLDGVSQRLIMPNTSTWMFTINVAAHRVDVLDGHAGIKIEGVCYRDVGANTVTILGMPVKTLVASTNLEWSVNVDVNLTDGALTVFATGQSNKTIRWAAQISIIEITN